MSIAQRAWEDPGDLFDTVDDGTVTIRRWPDGTWVLEEDYKAWDWEHMSDDCEVVEISQEEYDLISK